MVLTSFFLICSFNFQILNFCLFLLFGKCRNRMFPFGYDFTTACGVYSLTYIIHSGFISGYQNRYGDNLKPPTNVYHRMTA